VRVAAIGVDPDFGNYDGVQIIGNRVAGGAYGIFTAQNQGAKNVHCDGNVFVRGTFDYGPVAQVAGGQRQHVHR
jgi:glutamate-1-semialdehyde aminotransferase